MLPPQSRSAPLLRFAPVSFGVNDTLPYSNAQVNRFFEIPRDVHNMRRKSPVFARLPTGSAQGFPSGASERRTSGPNSAFGEHPLQGGRSIGHDSVDAEVQEVVHLLLVVDRPDVNMDPDRVSGLDETLVNDPNAVGSHGHLGNVAVHADSRAAIAGQPQPRDRARTHTNGHARPELGCGNPQTAIAERAETHPTMALGPLNRPNKR